MSEETKEPITSDSLIDNTMNIVKTEFFDENVLNHLKSTMMLESDRKMLERYLKNDKSVGKRIVKYELVKYSHGLGRLFPVKGLSLGTMRWDIRNPACSKFYWDIDFVNCQYHILLDDMKKNKQMCSNIEKYVLNREEVLKHINEDRQISKNILLKILYGGAINMLSEYDNEQLENLDVEQYRLTNSFLQEIKKEIESYQEFIWIKNEKLHDKRIGDCILNKKQNPKATMLAYHLQTIERDLLLILDNFLFSKNRHLDILIFDGGYVRKLPNETEFPIELLREAEEHILSKSGINIKLKQKEITHNFDYSEINELKVEYQNVEYITFKNEFEKTYFYHNDNSCIYKIISTGELNEISKSQIRDDIYNKKIKWKSNEGEIKYVDFLDKWIEDKDRLNYDRISFTPKKQTENDESIYNKFYGYDIDNITKDLDETEQFETCEKFLDSKVYKLMFEVLANYNRNNFDWLCYWIYHLLFTPYKPVEYYPLFVGRQGTGKGTFFYFLKKLIGNKYFYELRDAKPLIQKHNDFLQFKTLIIINEFDPKDVERGFSEFKSTITDSNITIEPKGKKSFMLNNTLHIIGASNVEQNTTEDNRRDAYFSINDKYKGDLEFFEEVRNDMNEKNIQIQFYYFIKKHYKDKFNFEKNFPKSNLKNDIIERTLLYNEHHIDFLKTLLTESTYQEDVENLIEKGIEKKDFYKLYCEVCATNSNSRFKGIGKVDFNQKLDSINDKKKQDFVTYIETGFYSIKKNGYYYWKLNDVKKFVEFVNMKYNYFIDTPFNSNKVNFHL